MFHKKPKTPEAQPRRRPLDRLKSTQVFSYYNGEPASADAPVTRKAVKQPLSRKQKLVVLYGSIAVLLLILAFCTTLSTQPAVSYAAGKTASPYRDTAVYQRRAHELLSENSGSLSKFTVNTAPVEEQLLKEFPELAAAHISLPVLGRRPNLILLLRTPALILTTKSNAFVLDSVGKTVSTIQGTDAAVRKDLPTLEDTNALPLKVGDQAVTSDTVQFIQLSLAQLKAKNLSVDHLTLPTVANELDIYIKDQPYFIKTDVSGNARTQIGSYLAVKESGVAPAAYMDVRVEEKVFYK